MKPLHPILVHFPIALLSLSVAADLIGYFADVASLRDTGWWALLGAALGGVATAAAGLYDMQRGGELVYRDGVFVAQEKSTVDDGEDSGTSGDHGHHH